MAELKGTLKVSNFLKGKLLPFGVSPGAVLYNMTQNLSEEEKARARANIGVGEGGGGEGGEDKDESQVFYAEYGVTTYDEVRAAFDAGKAVFAFSGIHGAGMIGSLVNISGEAIFVCHDGMNDMFFICDSNGWYEDFFPQPSAEPYELPTASATTLGGVKIGDGLAIDENGVLSVPALGDIASALDSINGEVV